MPDTSVLIKKAQEWIIEQLGDDISRVSVVSVFSHFREECESLGMYSGVSLYTCLSESPDPRLAHPRYPYIYREPSV